MPTLEVEDVVRERYRQGAQERVADLCCPVDYDPRYLAAIPDEVLGHRLRRGERRAVCDKTFRLYQREPYRSSFEFVEPLEEVPLAEAHPFDCSRATLRHPRETKGQDYQATTEAQACCEPAKCC